MEMADASKRPQFGNRLLDDPGKVFEHNAWDNVEWDAEQEEEARGKVQQNSKTPVDEKLQDQYENESDRFWDKFYTQHQNRFFKDRHWLFTEFPELAPKDMNLEDIPKRAEVGDGEGASTEKREAKPIGDQDCREDSERSAPKDDPIPSDHNPVGVATDCLASACNEVSHSETFPGQHSTTRILEVGCGVGNTVFPVLQTNNDPGLFVYCCDLSPTAIELVKKHPDYTEKRCHAFVCNVADPASSTPIPDGSLDIVILIFVLSAIHPDKFQSTITRLSKLLKPGGLMVLRDYGRHDLAQLRFKDGHCLSENFYVRGDGTRVYFFTQEELREMFVKAGLVEEQNYIDRRLQVNRGRQLKMYRVWIQCKYKKPSQPDAE